MTASQVFRKVRDWIQSTQVVKDDSGVALVAIVFILGSAALVGTTSVLMREQGIQAELREVRGQRANYDRIQDALEVYALQDFDGTGTADAGGSLYRLPCPADPTDADGLSEAWDGSNTCGTDNRGIVPWASIGLSRNDVIDDQGNFITYIVQEGTLEACNGTTPNVGSLDDQNSTTNYSYTLVGHGENGFGAFSSATNTQLTSPTSATEVDNCAIANGADNCTVGAGTNQFSTGPASDTLSSFFDDIVRPVELSENFTKECETLFEVDEETATVVSLGVDQMQDNITRTANDAAEFTRTVSLDISDNGTATDDSDDTAVLQFDGSNNSNPSASCAWFEPPIPIQGNVVRVYTEFSARTDTGDTRGNGAVFAFMSYDPDDVLSGLEGGSGYLLDNTICGGTDSYMGFADEQDAGVTADRRLPEVPRFGIEIDTEGNQGTDGEPDTDVGDSDNENQDPSLSPDASENAWNHAAIIGSNNDHEGNDQTDTGDTGDDSAEPSGTDRGDGPVCIPNLVGEQGAGNHLGDQGGGTIDDLDGCYPASNPLDIDDPNDPGMLIETGMFEVGDDSPTGDADFHQLRMDLTYGGGSSAQCTGLGDDRVFVEYWLFLANGLDDPRPSDCSPDYPDDPNPDDPNCARLTEDYASGNGEDAAKAFCVPWSEDFNDAYMRFGFTSGAEQVNASGRDNFTIRNFDLLSIARSPATAGTTAVDTQSVEVHNVNVVDEVVGIVHAGTSGFTGSNEESNMGLIDINDSTNTVFSPDRTDGGVRLIGRNGTFDFQMNGAATAEDLVDQDGIGMKGIGNDDPNDFDMLFIATDNMGTGTASDDEGTYPNADNPDARESIEIHFYDDDDGEDPLGTANRTAYERVALNLGRFGQTTLGTDAEEEVIVRAFSGSSLVREDTIASCNQNVNNGRHMFLTLDYTTPVDRLVIIPNFLDEAVPTPPAQYAKDTYGSSFYLRGVKGCDDTRACGLIADNDCVRYGVTGDFHPTRTLSGQDETGLETVYPYGSLGDPVTNFDVLVGDRTGLLTLQNLHDHFNAIYSAPLLGPVDDPVDDGNPASNDDETFDTVWQNLEGLMDLDTPGVLDADDGPVFVDIIGLVNTLRWNDSLEDYRKGFSIGGAGAASNTGEAFEFLWHNNWDTLLITLGGFGQQNDNPASPTRVERATITGYSDGSGTDVGEVVVTSCATFDTYGVDSDDEAMVNIAVDFNESTDAVNRLVIAPAATSGGQSSDFYIHAIRMCAEGQCMVTDSTDFGSLDDVGGVVDCFVQEETLAADP